VDLAVDGAQGVGLLDIDVKACGIHYMAFPAWKWLLGPLGLGILYVSSDRLDAIKPIFKGTESVPMDESYLPYKTAWKPGADRFAYSTGNFNDWVYFEASLGYLERIGFPVVRARILELARRLSDGLRARGFAVHADSFGGAETGIVVVSRPGLDSVAAVKALKAKGIIAAERLGRIRLAPHVYLSEAQMDRVIDELGSLGTEGS
jgi:selenocysteine lyase/cysteine desulfurase